MLSGGVISEDPAPGAGTGEAVTSPSRLGVWPPRTQDALAQAGVRLSHARHSSTYLITPPALRTGYESNVDIPLYVSC